MAADREEGRDGLDLDAHGGTFCGSPDCSSGIPKITVPKVADVSWVDLAGDVINYTIAVRNSGGVNLNTVIVTDTAIGAMHYWPRSNLKRPCRKFDKVIALKPG